MSGASVKDSSAPVAEAAAAGDGFSVIRAALATLPTAPGVYRMLDARGEPLYVGKARNLRKRVSNYAQPTRLDERLFRMVRLTASLEITTTASEVEALLLESNLIKKLKPRYNVVLRDDKSLPYILVARDHQFPQITKHRGARNRPGEYLGPFSSAGAVNQTLAALARAFPLRSCGDSEFAARTRPCLQYQIKRCTAPCVGRINAEDYGAIVSQARDFLAGRRRELQADLSGRMEKASAAKDYEQAAFYRDRLRAFAQITAKQAINVAGLGEADVIAAHAEGGLVCVQVFFFRAGQNLGNRAYFPAHARDVALDEVVAAFIGQFYAERPAPPLILVSHRVGHADLIAAALGQTAGRKVAIRWPQRGSKRAMLDNALANAREGLARRLAETSSQQELLRGVATTFGLPAPPERVEVYDNSHIQGSNPMGAMIVAGPDGFRKSAYRRFNLGNLVGDDYAMLREMLTRRFARLLKDGGEWPDLLLIDGGRGHLGVAVDVLRELDAGKVPVVAIAKGPDRDAGREHFYVPGKPPISLEPRHPVLYFLQRLRDEAHRFAIGGHRARRTRAVSKSMLDGIPGIGAARKKALLLRFGSARGVAAAGLADLESVVGVSRAVAKKVYDYFRGGG
jgi:excinuclease ABC subunit C